jgi:glycosyltransferase involved in cell wall biosynthesis
VTLTVSILTPSLNQGRWLRDNLRSVGMQSYPAIEQIVVDGGSTDDTIDILRGAPQSVRWSTGVDSGQSAAINKAYRLASGEIVGWLNSDDCFYSIHAVQRAVEAFTADPTVIVVYGHAVLANADGLILQMLWAPPFWPWLLRSNNFIVQPTAFVRRSAISGTSLVDEAYEYSMDRELWLRLARKGRFVRLNEIVSVDRHHRLRKSYTRGDLAKSDWERLVAGYGVPADTRPNQAARKFWKVILRLAGVALIPKLLKTETAVSVTVEPRKILARQLLQQRSRMPESGR